MTLFGGIEAGGTKFVCAVGTGPGDLRARTSFPTTTPAETIAQAIAFFKQQPEMVDAIGIGAFGPVDPNPASPTYGYITSTPKLAWQNTDIRGAMGENIPGHGLGLNLARQLARLHGGDVRLLRSDEEWTEFEVRFRHPQPSPAATLAVA